LSRAYGCQPPTFTLKQLSPQLWRGAVAAIRDVLLGFGWKPSAAFRR
jgi:hypothetical protein